MSRISYLILIECDDPARLWTGLGWLDIPPDDIEPAGGRYLGGGQIVSIPDFQQLINGIAERLSAGVSGVTVETMRLALEQAASVKGADFRIARVTFDADWQLSTVEWIALFRVDKLTTDRQNDDSGGQSRSISLSIGTGETDRSGAPFALFTHADQIRRSPTDMMMSQVAGITAGTSRRFGLLDGN